VVKGIRIVFSTHHFCVNEYTEVVVKDGEGVHPKNTIAVSTDVAYYIFETSQSYALQGGKVFQVALSLHEDIFDQYASFEYDD